MHNAGVEMMDLNVHVDDTWTLVVGSSCTCNCNHRVSVGHGSWQVREYGSTGSHCYLQATMGVLAPAPVRGFADSAFKDAHRSRVCVRVFIRV